MYKLKARNTKRDRRHARIRPKVLGVAEFPRMSVFRSNKYIYAQVIDDTKGITIASASSLSAEKGAKVKQAQDVGSELAKKVIEAGIKKVKFDRNGFRYHGRIKSLADAARNEGLEL